MMMTFLNMGPDMGRPLLSSSIMAIGQILPNHSPIMAFILFPPLYSPLLSTHLCLSHSSLGRIDIGRDYTFSQSKRLQEKFSIARTNLRICNPPLQSFSSYGRCATGLAMAEVESRERAEEFGELEAGLLVEELRKRYRSGITKSYEWRMLQLKRIETMLHDREEDILEALSADLSKPHLEAFASEISMTRSSCKLALKQLKNWMKPEKVKTSIASFPSSAEIVSEPLGVVLIISAWNFPFLLSIDPVIGAIAAGNCVVLKPSELASRSSFLMAKLFEEYLDNSSIRVVEGAVSETSALLHQKWDKIFFTGGARVARIVMTAAAKHLTPVVLELGGKCPAVVDSNVNLQVATKRIIAGKWACNNGQACIGVDYIITTKDFAPKLIDALKHKLEEWYGKDAMESDNISRIVSSTHFSRLLAFLEEDGISQKIVFGGQTVKDNLKIGPTILLDLPEESLMMKEEIFGPLLPIVTVEKLEESFEIINSKPKPLAAYLFTNDESLKKNFVGSVSSGGMLVNDTVLHLTESGLPFGGVGESGMGSYHGKFSFEAFSHKKAVLYRRFEGDASLRYPPYTPQKERLLKAVLGGNIFSVLLALLTWSNNK